MFFYVMWSDSASSVLEARLKEISLQLDESLRDLSDEALLAAVIEVISRGAQRSYFKQTTVSDNVQRQVAEINAHCKKPWSCQHLLSGFMCATAPEWTEDTPVLSNEDVMLIWGHMNFLLKRRSKQ